MNSEKISDPSLIRLPGTSAFLTPASVGMPLPMTHFLRHNHALHKRVLLVTVQSSDQPRVPDDQRAEVTDLGSGVSRIILHFGFTEQPNVPAAVREVLEKGLIEPIDLNAISYSIGRETIIPSERPSGMARWREALFAFVQRNSERSAVWLSVPPAQVVEIGTEIEL